MKKILFVFPFILTFCTTGTACTSVLISAKASKDGRPMILKNRDTGTLSNYCIQAKGEKYRFIGIANAKDTKPEEIWGGHNEKGFAIINTANYNLNKKNEKDELEGVFMCLALGQCETLSDFEKFMDNRKHPLCVNTNFGVIDAQGGCAYYEVGNDGYVKFDVNDSKVAPKGYLIRTNFGFTGDRSKDQGAERFLAITEFMNQAYASNKMEVSYLATNIPRYLKHGLTHLNLADYMPASEKDTTMMPFRDFIPRYSTASCILVQGVKKNESAEFTTSWLYVGYPLTTVCVPIIINPQNKLPKTFTDCGDGSCWMATKGLELKQRLFPYNVSSGHDYINVAWIFNKKGTGILQQIKPWEDTIIQKGENVISKIRKEKKFSNDLYEYYDWVDSFITDNFSKL